MKNRFIICATAIGLLVLGGCSILPSKPPPAPVTQADFVATPDQPKIFIFVSYDDPLSKPYFADSFRIHVDGGYSADIDDHHFVVERELPGEYTVDIDRIDWLNTDQGHLLENKGPVSRNKGHATIKLQLTPGAVVFVQTRVAPDMSLSIMQIDREQGIREISARIRACAC